MEECVVLDCNGTLGTFSLFRDGRALTIHRGTDGKFYATISNSFSNKVAGVFEDSAATEHAVRYVCVEDRLVAILRGQK